MVAGVWPGGSWDLWGDSLWSDPSKKRGSLFFHLQFLTGTKPLPSTTTGRRKGSVCSEQTLLETAVPQRSLSWASGTLGLG